MRLDHLTLEVFEAQRPPHSPQQRYDADFLRSRRCLPGIRSRAAIFVYTTFHALISTDRCRQ
jgi:hypothetical protein